MREGRFIEEKKRELEDGSIALEPPWEVQWPTVGVDSHQFKALPHHERLRRLSQGYLSSAKSLTIELGENPERLDWPRASVACFCFYHSIELFLKACILYRFPTAKITTHDVAELLIRYHEHYPVDKFFAFQCPWCMRLKDVEKLFGHEPSNACLDGKVDQVFRYSADMDGTAPAMTTNFVPGNWLPLMEHFQENMDRIWENILETYSPNCQASRGQPLL